MPRRHATAIVPDAGDDDDRDLHKPRVLEDSMFLKGEFAGESLEDVWDEDPDYLRKLLKDDDLHPEDRREISELVEEEDV